MNLKYNKVYRRFKQEVAVGDIFYRRKRNDVIIEIVIFIQGCEIKLEDCAGYVSFTSCYKFFSEYTPIEKLNEIIKEHRTYIEPFILEDIQNQYTEIIKNKYWKQ